MQNANATSKRRGRRPAFDRGDVISAAIQAFWAKGFEATTLSDLEAATGVDRSTLYNSFGGKDGLYRSATMAYVDLAQENLFKPLFEGAAGLGDIVEFIDMLGEAFGSQTNPSGCLIVNDMASTTDRQATNYYLRSLDDGLRAALDRASAAGEVDPARADPRRRFLSAAVLGINLAGRSADDNSAALDLIEGVRAEVRSWMD